tara:strand:+ start:704 stop:958 length:255 start_codon:yes stop_codon:yes gene_type:complete
MADEEKDIKTPESFHLNEVKEAYELFWLVKGHLSSSHTTIMESENGYFKRLWCLYQGEDMSYKMEGFEEAWKQTQYYKDMKNDK